MVSKVDLAYAKTAVEREGYTLDEAAAMSDRDLKKIPGIGRRRIKAIRMFVEASQQPRELRVHVQGKDVELVSTLVHRLGGTVDE